MKKNFKNVLNDGGRLEVQDEVKSDKASIGRKLMSECLTKEEVEQAQGSLKKIALGSDGLTSESAAICRWTFGAASPIGAGGMGRFLLSEEKV